MVKPTESSRSTAFMERVPVLPQKEGSTVFSMKRSWHTPAHRKYGSCWAWKRSWAATRSILRHKNILLVETVSSFCKRDISIFHVNLLYNPHSFSLSHIHLLYRLHQLHHKPDSNLHALNMALTLVSCTQFKYDAHILVCFLVHFRLSFPVSRYQRPKRPIQRIDYGFKFRCFHRVKSCV